MQNLIWVVVMVVAVAGAYFFLMGTPATENVEMETAQEVMNDDMGMEESEAEVEAQGSTIVELAVGTESLSTLVAAVTAGDLADTLSSEGPFTVFAPTNEAFSALPEGTVDTLLLPDNIADLQAILTYHVVPGKVMSGELTDGMVVETVNGETITINVSADGAVSINGSASVALADIEASNGVVHVIDSVLLP